MATRRVKRIKHTKKHLQHGRRKTKHRRRKTNRHTRITRRHQGGMLKGVAKFFTKTINPKGGSLYDGIEVFSAGVDKFHIGNRRLDQYDASSVPNDRVYADKIRFYLKSAGISHSNDMIVLDQSNFDKFVAAFASNKFVPAVDSDVASAVASAAAAPNIRDQVAESLDLKTLNQLKVNEQYIAYMNHSGIVKGFQVDKSKTEYEFDNFTITLSDGSIITGTLKINFVSNVAEKTVTTNFTLKLNVDASHLIVCMQTLIDASFVDAQITSIKLDDGVFSKKLVVNGVLTENRDYRTNLSMYNLQYLIEAFAKRHQECSDIVTQFSELKLAGPEALKQQSEKASGNLELLNQISVGMDQLADARRARVYPSSGASGPVMPVVPVVPVVPASAEEKLARLLEMDKD